MTPEDDVTARAVREAACCIHVPHLEASDGNPHLTGEGTSSGWRTTAPGSLSRRSGNVIEVRVPDRRPDRRARRRGVPAFEAVRIAIERDGLFPPADRAPRGPSSSATECRPARAAVDRTSRRSSRRSTARTARAVRQPARPLAGSAVRSLTNAIREPSGDQTGLPSHPPNPWDGPASRPTDRSGQTSKARARRRSAPSSPPGSTHPATTRPFRSAPSRRARAVAPDPSTLATKSSETGFAFNTPVARSARPAFPSGRDRRIREARGRTASPRLPTRRPPARSHDRSRGHRRRPDDHGPPRQHSRPSGNQDMASHANLGRTSRSPGPVRVEQDQPPSPSGVTLVNTIRSRRATRPRPRRTPPERRTGASRRCRPVEPTRSGIAAR